MSLENVDLRPVVKPEDDPYHVLLSTPTVPVPILDATLYTEYANMKAQRWDVGDISLATDLDHWNDDRRVSPEEREMLELVLAFFRHADLKVDDNLYARMLPQGKLWELKAFWQEQASNENVHGETYAVLLTQLVRDHERRARLEDRVSGEGRMAAVRAKERWMDEATALAGDSLGALVLVWCLVEGIMFSSSFACIFHFKDTGALPGVRNSNLLIQKDEWLHCRVGAYLYRSLRSKPAATEAIRLLRSAADTEIKFAKEVLRKPIPGLNAALLCEYVRHIANIVSEMLGLEVAFPGATQPLPYMEMAGAAVKTNFFEARNVEYGQANVLHKGLPAVFEADSIARGESPSGPLSIAGNDSETTLCGSDDEEDDF